MSGTSLSCRKINQLFTDYRSFIARSITGFMLLLLLFVLVIMVRKVSFVIMKISDRMGLMHRSPGARRRRRKVNKKDDPGDTLAFSRKNLDKSSYREINERIFHDKTIDKNYLIDGRSSTETFTPSSIDIDLPPSTSPQSDESFDKTSKPVTVRKVSRAELLTVDKTKTVNQVPDNLEQSIDIIDDGSTPLSSDGLLNIDLNRIHSNNLNTSETNVVNTNQVHVERIPRTSRLSRVSDVHPISRARGSTMQLDRATIDTSLKANRSAGTVLQNQSLRKTNSVIVTKIRRVHNSAPSIK